MFKFSGKSKKQLHTCHYDMSVIMNTAIKISNIDFGISEGLRSLKTQNEYFLQGLSKIDGFKKKGKHNYIPSLAADIYIYQNGAANWDKETLSYVAGLIHAVAELLFDKHLINHKIRWGGNWDMDGEILTDQFLDDRPHFELYKP